MNERDKLLRKSRGTKFEFDRRAYQNKRNRVNILLQTSKSSYSKNLLEQNANDPENLWKTLKSIYPSSSSENVTCKTFDIGGEKCKDSNNSSIDKVKVVAFM